MTNGFCKLTAITQMWMDREPAVKTWEKFGRDYANFEYDDEIEIADAPKGVLFADDDWDDARVAGVEQAIEIAISELDATDDELEALANHYHSDGWGDYADEIVDSKTARRVARQRLDWLRKEREWDRPRCYVHDAPEGELYVAYCACPKAPRECESCGEELVPDANRTFSKGTGQ